MYQENSTVASLMKRGYLYLEDHEWESAKDYFDDSLDADPENAPAYIGILLAEMHMEKESDLCTAEQPFADNYYFVRALRFADDDYRVKLQHYNFDNSYFLANRLSEAATSEADYRSAAAIFATIRDYRDAAEREAECLECAEKSRIEALYTSSKALINSKDVADIIKAKQSLESIKDYKDSAELLTRCAGIIEDLEKKRVKKLALISACAIIAAITVFVILGIKISSINKRAEIIYQNFLGETFEGELIDNDGFAYEFRNKLDGATDLKGKVYKVTGSEKNEYWLTSDKISLDFKEDGSVHYTNSTDKDLLAYNWVFERPYDGESHDKHEYTYDSFEVRVTWGGDVYLLLGSEKYRVSVSTDGDVPNKIPNFKNMTLIKR